MTLSTAVRLRPAAIALCLLALLAALPARAQAPAADRQAAIQAEIDAAYKAGLQAGTRGPAKVALIDQATLSIPADHLFMPKAEATRFLRALGNTITGDTPQGLVLGLKRRTSWIVVVRHIKEGYIKDDEAKDWKADELLANLKEGHRRGQQGPRRARICRDGDSRLGREADLRRRARIGWSGRCSSKDKGAPDTAVKGINYNTYALGRDGYFSLNLLTNSNHVGGDKAVARTLLAALAYNEGKAYEDFNASTDHIAAYGIAALVGGIAAKKLGLFALIGVFVLKFAKVIAIGVAAFVAGVWKLFGRKRESA